MSNSKPFEVNFTPNPVQKAFILSRANADLFSSRVGEGKSTALSWAIFHHTRHNPGADWAVIRDTYENLRKTTMETFFTWFPPGVFGTFHVTSKTFTWHESVAKGTVTFVGMDDPKDASKLLSWELSGFAMDEPAPAVGSAGIDEQIFDLAMTRLRKAGMNWYAAKLATNNPDESHWTYKKFANPATKIQGYTVWQPAVPENKQNLPDGYYETMRTQLAHRPDLIRRFVDGEYGFQSEGKSVTPQWSDKIHLANGLSPIRGPDLYLLWDFGHNPTCVITQKSPMGHWNMLDAYVGDGIGAAELIGDIIKPLILSDRYGRGKHYNLKHIGDPAGQTAEQTSIKRSPVGLIKAELGGTWRPGPVKPRHRIPALQQVLSRTINGTGVVQVDRSRAEPVWHALRGGWHYHVARTGLVSENPKKNEHSHPGDAVSYGAALLFPLGTATRSSRGVWTPQEAKHFGGWRIGPESTISHLPRHGAKFNG